MLLWYFIDERHWPFGIREAALQLLKLFWTILLIIVCAAFYEYALFEDMDFYTFTNSFVKPKIKLKQRSKSKKLFENVVNVHRMENVAYIFGLG